MQVIGYHNEYLETSAGLMMILVSDVDTNFTDNPQSCLIPANVMNGGRCNFFARLDGNLGFSITIGSRYSYDKSTKIATYPSGAGTATYNYSNTSSGYIPPFAWVYKDPSGNYAGSFTGTGLYVSYGSVQTQVTNSSFGEAETWLTYALNTSVRKNDDLTAFITGAAPVEYEWRAWDQISGNSGQYRCSLTKIKDAEIGDPSTLQGGDISDFNRLSSQSSIWNLYHNIPLGVETKIAWSGPGWMSLTLSEIPQSNPRSINFQFKFYAPQVSSTTPIYVENRAVAVEGNAALKVIDMFLSFIYDNEQQAALFYPVDHNEYGDYLWGYVNSHTADEMLYLYLWLNQSSAGTPDTPYDDGTQDTGGEPGNPIPQSHIDVPSYNTSGGLTDGVVTLYRLTTAQLQDIAGWLWSSDFIDNLNKFMGSADECLLSLTALPVKPANLSTKQFRAGNVGFVVSGTSDPYNVEYVEQRFFKLDMGDFVFTPFWDSYLDFAPYSSIEVYLPGVGVQKLDIDDIACPANIDGSLPAARGSRIHLDYIIDMVTGVLVAFISINGELRYQFPGKVGYTIPLTGENYTRMIQGYVTATAGLIGTVASGGAAAPFTASAASAGIINAMKPDIYRGGNFSGDASMLSSRKPYLIYRRPNKPELIGQENFTGFPSYKSGEVGDFSGYTEFLDVHVEGISCTEEERDQILAILKGGVLL